MQFLIFVVFAGAMYWFYYNFLLGYRKKNITLTFDDRYYSLDEHVTAIEQKLATEGHSARYLGDRRFEVDGKPYLFLERTVPVGGVPTQQTILEQQKNNSPAFGRVFSLDRNPVEGMWLLRRTIPVHDPMINTDLIRKASCSK